MAYTRCDESIDAVRAASKALALAPESSGDQEFSEADHARALVCRATAYFRLDDTDRAAQDVHSAESIESHCPPESVRALQALRSHVSNTSSHQQSQQHATPDDDSDASSSQAPAGLGGMGLSKKQQHHHHQQQQQQQQQNETSDTTASTEMQNQQTQEQQRRSKQSELVNLKATLDGDTRNIIMMKGVALSDLQDAVRRRFPEQDKAMRMFTANGSLIASDNDLLAATESALARHRKRVEQLQEQQQADAQALMSTPAPMHVTLELTRPGYSGSDRDASELEDWVLEFTSVFREHAGVDAETHCELVNEGTKKTNNALDAKVSFKDARNAFDDASSKFNEAGAYALANCGNCYLVRARRLIDAHRPPPASSEEGNSSQPPRCMPKEEAERGEEFLQEAEKRFNEALKTSPKHVDALVGKVQMLHERARMLSADIGVETEDRLMKAEKTYTETEKAFEGVIGDVPDQPRLMDQPPHQQQEQQHQIPQGGSANNEEDVNEAPRSMQSQVRVLWGNVLFEHSQFRARQGGQWKSLLDKACVQFRRAGCPQNDIDNACAGHLSRLEQQTSK